MVVTTSWAKAEALRGKLSENNRNWIGKDLHRITWAEAVQRRPSLALQRRHPGLHYYRCDNFDVATKRCRLHGTPAKPDTCTGFPWYGRQPADSPSSIADLPRCSFLADVIWPFIPGLA